ncbi:plasmid mobilization protein [Cohnella rhizosphaerae]|uniref:plasmid mobilization protein n=1 Tax=Cohnella rhizosphaerae TaxID=1457232 RepID=UPI003B8A7554
MLQLRARRIKIMVRLNEQEQKRLVQQVKQTGLSQEAYLRSLINGYIPKSLPPMDYYTMLRELHAIGNNMNQLAAKAHTTGHPDRNAFQREAEDLRQAIQQIQEAVTAPEPQQTPP